MWCLTASIGPVCQGLHFVTIDIMVVKRDIEFGISIVLGHYRVLHAVQ